MANNISSFKNLTNLTADLQKNKIASADANSANSSQDLSQIINKGFKEYMDQAHQVESQTTQHTLGNSKVGIEEITTKGAEFSLTTEALVTITQKAIDEVNKILSMNVG